MNLLEKLQLTIESLKTNPSDLDITDILSTLSEAYALASDGLQRSQAASRLPDLIKERDRLAEDLESAKELIAQLEPEKRIANENFSNFKPIVEMLKNRTIGKIILLRSISQEKKDMFISQLNQNNYHRYAEIITEVEDLFKKDFLNQTQKKKNTVFVDHKLFSSQGAKSYA